MQFVCRDTSRIVSLERVIFSLGLLLRILHSIVYFTIDTPHYTTDASIYKIIKLRTTEVVTLHVLQNEMFSNVKSSK